MPFEPSQPFEPDPQRPSSPTSGVDLTPVTRDDMVRIVAALLQAIRSAPLEPPSSHEIVKACCKPTWER